MKKNYEYYILSTWFEYDDYPKTKRSKSRYSYTDIISSHKSLKDAKRELKKILDDREHLSVDLWEDYGNAWICETEGDKIIYNIRKLEV